MDFGARKSFRITERVSFDFRAELLNAFNHPYFNPASAGGVPLGFTSPTTGPAGPVASGGTPIGNTTAANNVDSYRLTALLGDNQSRLVQLVWRVSLLATRYLLLATTRDVI